MKYFSLPSHCTFQCTCLRACGCLQQDYTWVSMALCSEGQPSWAILAVSQLQPICRKEDVASAYLRLMCDGVTKVHLEKRLWSFRKHVTLSNLGLLCEGFLDQDQLVPEDQRLWLLCITQQPWTLPPWETSTASSQFCGQPGQSQLAVRLLSITFPRNSPPPPLMTTFRTAQCLLNTLLIRRWLRLRLRHVSPSLWRVSFMTMLDEPQLSGLSVLEELVCTSHFCKLSLEVELLGSY